MPRAQELDFTKPLPEVFSDLMRRPTRHKFNSKEVLKGADFRVSLGFKPPAVFRDWSLGARCNL